jgi:uncharacterized protein (TIGR00369 family)
MSEPVRELQPTRSRIVEWEDPSIGPAALASMSGLEYLQAMMAGDLPGPPIAALLGQTLDSVSPGRAVFSLEVGEHQYNPIGSVHGGVLSTLLDSAVGCAVHTTLAAGQGYTSLELKVNFVKRLTVATTRVEGIGEVLSAGRRVATASGKVLGPDGTLYAHATTTCLIFDL